MARLEPPEKPKARLSGTQIASLVAELKASIEAYALPDATPATLEPQLSTLSSGVGREAAAGMLKVHDHCGGLLRHVEENIGYLGRRVKALLREAERKKAEAERGGASARPREGGYGGLQPRADLEARQRQLELSEKKIRILEGQRARLDALRGAVLAELVHFTDPEAIDFLLGRFDSEDEPPLRQAILAPLAAARAVRAIPHLSSKLSHPDVAFKAALRRTLTAIVGQDLGDAPPPWRKWWEEQPKA